jgi:hypothetical protein
MPVWNVVGEFDYRAHLSSPLRRRLTPSDAVDFFEAAKPLLPLHFRCELACNRPGKSPSIRFTDDIDRSLRKECAMRSGRLFLLIIISAATTSLQSPLFPRFTLSVVSTLKCFINIQLMYTSLLNSRFSSFPSHRRHDMNEATQFYTRNVAQAIRLVSHLQHNRQSDMLLSFDALRSELALYERSGHPTFNSDQQGKGTPHSDDFNRDNA